MNHRETQRIGTRPLVLSGALVALGALAAASCASTAGSSDAGSSDAAIEEPDGSGAAADAAQDSDASTDEPPDPYVMDCREDLVDSFWGDAPPYLDRMTLFYDLWNMIGGGFAGFSQVSADWDVVGEQGRQAIAEATSMGRFYQALNEIFLALGDGHAVLLSKRIAGLTDEQVEELGTDLSPLNPVRPPLEQRPPLYWMEERISTIDACVTRTDDGSLLVYRAASGNPAGLAVGDRIIGYDGATWEQILGEIDRCRLPVLGRTASNEESRALERLGSVVNNAHLFEHLDVRKRGTGALERIPTAALIDHVSDLVCSDQVAVDGVAPPCARWSDCYVSQGAPDAAWGVLPGSNIGYVYIYGWRQNSAFDAAIQALWNTDGLIFDQRFGVGGVYPWGLGIEALFDDTVVEIDELRRTSTTDYFAVEATSRHTFSSPHPKTFYDHPIAVLTGPHMGSAGDLFPYMMSFHPRARRFGRATDGRFSVAFQYNWGGAGTAWDPYLGDMQAFLSDRVFATPEGDILFGTMQEPEERVWLTADDVVQGSDTVVESALEWIETERSREL